MIDTPNTGLEKERSGSEEGGKDSAEMTEEEVG